jgi:hypothetical protein
MRKHVHRRFRVREQGLDADVELNAVVSINVSDPRSEGPDDASPETGDARPDAPADRPPTEDEGGER